MPVLGFVPALAECDGLPFLLLWRAIVLAHKAAEIRICYVH